MNRDKLYGGENCKLRIVKPYFFTCLFISIIGTLLNTAFWILDDVMNGSFGQDLPFHGWHFYLAVSIVSLVLSIICSYTLMLITWIIESRKENVFVLFWHLFLLVFAFSASFYMGLIKELFFPFFVCYYLPGVFAYYYFVQRKRGLHRIESELLDRD